MCVCVCVKIPLGKLTKLSYVLDGTGSMLYIYIIYIIIYYI